MTKSPELACRLLDVDEVAALLRLSARSIYRLAEKGQLTVPVRIGRNLRWREDEIIAYIRHLPQQRPSHSDAEDVTVPGQPGFPIRSIVE